MKHKLKIREVIIVEGIHDKQKVESCVNAEVLVTTGKHISKQFLDLCDQLNKERGIIVFTDPDGPGTYIRRRIVERVGTCKHASLHISQARNKNKVGIEHATTAMILDALERVAIFDVDKVSLSRGDFHELGLAGQTESQALRDRLAEHYSIPRMNAKRCFKVLNMLGLTKEEIRKTLTGGDDCGNHSE